MTQNLPDDWEPPHIGNALHGRFLDSPAVAGIKNQFLTLEEAQDAARLQYPKCRGITMELIDNIMIFTIRSEGKVVALSPDTADNYTTWLLSKRIHENQVGGYAKELLSQMNFLFSFVSILMIGSSIYVFFADWGALDTSFFHGVGGIALTLGVILFCGTYIGDKGMEFYNEDIEDIPYMSQGPQLLKVFLGLQMVAFTFIIYCLLVGIEQVQGLRDNEELMNQDVFPPPDFTYLESKIKDKFDPFFFGAMTSDYCPDLKYAWMWLVVNDICDENMQETTCSECYGATCCDADPYACDYGVPGLFNGTYNNACPYNACRKNLLKHIIDNFDAVSIAILSLTLYILIMIVLTITLVCFNPRSRWNMMQVKYGLKPSTQRRYKVKKTSRKPSKKKELSRQSKSNTDEEENFYKQAGDEEGEGGEFEARTL